MLMNRKRWFVKVMWAYIPCSVEDYGCYNFCRLYYLRNFLNFISGKSYGVDLNVIKIIFFSVILITALSIAKRHS
jgi:hypothetical protein